MSENVHVNVPTTVQGVTSGAYSSPEFLKYMQQQVREVIERSGEMQDGTDEE